MKTSHLIVLSLIVIVFGLPLWIVITTPSASSIVGCVTTKKYNVLLCPKNKNYVQLKDVSPLLVDLVLIAEDFSFYDHNGFDWSEIENSFKANFSSGRLVRGGSTITQQLAKNVYLDFDKSFFRKIREALLARQIEKILNKNQILERYLNVIELGPKIYGVRAASQYYFNKEPADVNLLEAAFITYLIPNPKVYSKVFDKRILTDFARYRILDLCYRMFRFGRVQRDTYSQAKSLVYEFPWYGIDFNSPDFYQSQVEMVPDPNTPESDPALGEVIPNDIEGEIHDEGTKVEEAPDEGTSAGEPQGQSVETTPAPDSPMLYEPIQNENDQPFEN